MTFLSNLSSQLLLPGGIWKELGKNKVNEPTFSFLAQIVEKWWPVEKRFFKVAYQFELRKTPRVLK
jgi:hypothetical protein